jgi:hypothetical protein
MPCKFIVVALAMWSWAATAANAADNGMGFAIDVSLSPPAAAKLASLKEKIDIAVVWHGEPTKAGKRHADEMGEIDLGTETVRVSGAGGRAEIAGRDVKVANIGWIKDKKVQANVNVFSARLGSKDNLLDCDFFDDSVAKARDKPLALRCKLIGEK